MEITEHHTADVLTLGLSGRLDATSAKALEDRLLAHIDSGGRRIAVDLARLEYISSAGLRVFILAAKRLDKVHGKIVLCALTDPVQEIFDIAGFTPLFAIHDSHQGALQALQ
jgi:anti-sigma B factor antagonist